MGAAQVFALCVRPVSDDVADCAEARVQDVDPRVTCQACRHYRPHECRNHRAALLQRPEVSRALAALPQWCPGWTIKPEQPIGKSYHDSQRLSGAGESDRKMQ